MFLCMTVLAEETAIREVWEETGVRAGNGVVQRLCGLHSIDPSHLLKWLFSGHCTQCWFQEQIQKK